MSFLLPMHPYSILLNPLLVPNPASTIHSTYRTQQLPANRQFEGELGTTPESPLSAIGFLHLALLYVPSAWLVSPGRKKTIYVGRFGEEMGEQALGYAFPLFSGILSIVVDQEHVEERVYRFGYWSLPPLFIRPG